MLTLNKEEERIGRFPVGRFSVCSRSQEARRFSLFLKRIIQGLMSVGDSGFTLSLLLSIGIPSLPVSWWRHGEEEEKGYYLEYSVHRKASQAFHNYQSNWRQTIITLHLRTQKRNQVIPQGHIAQEPCSKGFLFQPTLLLSRQYPAGVLCL